MGGGLLMGFSLEPLLALQQPSSVAPKPIYISEYSQRRLVVTQNKVPWSRHQHLLRLSASASSSNNNSTASSSSSSYIHSTHASSVSPPSSPFPPPSSPVSPPSSSIPHPSPSVPPPSSPVPSTSAPMLALLDRLSSEMTSADRDSQLVPRGRILSSAKQDQQQKQHHQQQQQQQHQQQKQNGQKQQWTSDGRWDRRQDEGENREQAEDTLGQAVGVHMRRTQAYDGASRVDSRGTKNEWKKNELKKNDSGVPWSVSRDTCIPRSPINIKGSSSKESSIRGSSRRSSFQGQERSSEGQGGRWEGVRGGSRMSENTFKERRDKTPQPCSTPKPNVSRSDSHVHKRQGEGMTGGRSSRQGEGMTAGRSSPAPPPPGGYFPFHDFVHSYSETPRIPPIGYREPRFTPFGPDDMASRPWTGGAPIKMDKGGTASGMPVYKYATLDGKGAMPLGTGGADVSQSEEDGTSADVARESVLGVPLSEDEVEALVKECNKDTRQVNLGRDGLVHNMLDLIHSHWKRRPLCRLRCKGVPTVDMDNVVRTVEERTGGAVVRRAGGVLYVFRGRHYNYKTRPRINLMLWKPPAPIYPQLIEDAPADLTLEEANALRVWGRRVKPACKLAKNGVYLNLVQTVRATLAQHALCRVDCRGLEKSDLKKIGAKLRDLVPCVLLSFERDQILMWKDDPNRKRPFLLATIPEKDTDVSEVKTLEESEATRFATESAGATSEHQPGILESTKSAKQEQEIDGSGLQETVNFV